HSEGLRLEERAPTVGGIIKLFLSGSGQTVCLGGPELPCYKIAYFHDVTSRVAFSEALEACKMDGGSLLSIESHAEQKDIENLGGGGGIADGDFWIGLTRVDGVDQTETGSSFVFCSQRYRWTDGSLATFRNWYFDEPSCGGEACVVMYHQPTALHGLGGAYLYQWNDDRCNMKHNFICKYQPGTNSQSASPSLDTHGGRATGEQEILNPKSTDPNPSPPVSIPLTAIHSDVTLTENNFTSEEFKDSVCPLFISKETRQCIKGSITLYLTLWLRSRRFYKNRLTIGS
uniref:Chondrolectin n=1 Tax=Sander lucioperca TaxID=283035 RepID=A0A8C9Z2Y1_SANLU